MRFPFLSSSCGLLALVGIVAACSSKSSGTATPAAPPPPAAVCKTPGPASARWFSDVTAAYGLGPQGAVTPVASALSAADLDGDGFADVFTEAVTSHRAATDATWKGKQVRFLYMNRPDPSDATKRVFVDALAGSGLLDTRDGAGNRGFGLADMGDLDDDGDVDVVLCPTDEVNPTSKPEDACDAFLNDGKAHFTLAPPSDLGKTVMWVPGSVLFDYDRDGFLDFWPSTVAHWPYNPLDTNVPPKLFRGNGDGTFNDVSVSVGLPAKDALPSTGKQYRHVFGNTACDLDGDGDDDMILASYGREENQVWRNDNGHFVEVGHALGIDHDDRQDYSDDQSFRCFCAANPTDTTCTPMPPAPGVTCTDAFGAGSGPYFRGWQPGVTDQSWSLGGNNFTIACGDIDDDGDMDILSATIVHGDVGSSADPSELALNPGPGQKFTRPGNDKTGLLRKHSGFYWNDGDSMSVMVDIDLDGRKDILLTETGAYGTTDTSALFHQKTDGTFERNDSAAGIVTGSVRNLTIPVFIDIDGDGDLDLVTSQTTATAQPLVFLNNVGQDQNLVRVHLDGGAGTGVNRSAVGAVVRVTAGGRTQTQYVSGGYGHGNVQNDFVLTFGLGAACAIDKIEVRWPDASATVTSYPNVVSNYDVTLTFGKTDPAYGTHAY